MSDNSHIRTSTSKSLRLVEEMATAITALSQVRDVEGVAKVVRNAARRLVDADGACFVVREGETCHYVGHNALSTELRSADFALDSCLPGWCILKRKAARVLDVRNDAMVRADLYDQSEVRSLIVVPIRRYDPVGAIEIYWQDEHVATDEEVRFVQALADSISVTMRDIELMNSLEHLVTERTESLLAVNEELQSFAFSVSHDLKDPLSVMKANSWTLKEMYADDLPDRALDCVEQLERAANKMRRQIDGMLSLHRLTKGDFNPAEVNLSLIAHEIIDDLGEVDPEKKIIVTIEKELTGLGDQELLRVALQNLLGNA